MKCAVNVLIQLEKITQEGGSATAVTRARAVKILYKKTEAFGTCFFPPQNDARDVPSEGKSASQPARFAQ
jgi:hypothetical protein